MPATAKSTLMAIAYFADNMRFSSPFIPTLSTLTYLSERAIHNAIHYLEDARLLNADRRNGRYTKYLLTPPVEPELHDTDSGLPDWKDIHSGEKDIPTPRNSCAPAGDAPPQQMQLTPAFLAVVSRDFCVKPPQELRSKKSFSLSKSKRERSSLNGSRLSSTWTPTDEDQQWAQQERPGLDTAMEIIKFRNYWTNVCTDRGIKYDWSLAWQSWILQAHRVRSSDTGIIDAVGQAQDAIEVLEKIAHGSVD